MVLSSMPLTMAPPLISAAIESLRHDSPPEEIAAKQVDVSPRRQRNSRMMIRRRRIGVHLIMVSLYYV
jgi:hypothetical protein